MKKSPGHMTGVFPYEEGNPLFEWKFIHVKVLRDLHELTPFSSIIHCLLSSFSNFVDLIKVLRNVKVALPLFILILPLRP